MAIHGRRLAGPVAWLLAPPPPRRVPCSATPTPALPLLLMLFSLSSEPSCWPLAKLSYSTILRPAAGALAGFWPMLPRALLLLLL